MAACYACGTTIVFGGVQENGVRYCNAGCRSRGNVARVAIGLPPDVVRNEVSAVFHGSCPKCQGPGPVDVHTSYQIWSAFLFTQFKSVPQISCKRCGVKSQIGNALFSAVLGWWGFPWGILMTPVQITRNIMGIFRGGDATGPSPDLERMVRMAIASHTARQYQ